MGGQGKDGGSPEAKLKVSLLLFLFFGQTDFSFAVG